MVFDILYTHMLKLKWNDPYGDSVSALPQEIPETVFHTNLPIYVVFSQEPFILYSSTVRIKEKRHWEYGTLQGLSP